MQSATDLQTRLERRVLEHDGVRQEGKLLQMTSPNLGEHRKACSS